MNKAQLQAILEKHQKWLSNEDGGERANLRGADLDFSCFPLWCGSNKMKVDRKIAAQIALHFVCLDCDDEDFIKAREAILEFAKSSHRASDMGLYLSMEV